MRSRGKGKHMRTHVSRRKHNGIPRFAIAFSTVSLLVIVAAFMIFGGRSVARAQSAGNVQAIGSMSDVMVSMVYPATNNILLFVYRGGPQSDADWASVQRSAVLLAETGNLLAMRGPTGNQGDWAKDAKALVDAGAATYRAARAKDTKALLAVDQPINASCVNCHKQYRFNSNAPANP
jgi:hypothetical protein